MLRKVLTMLCIFAVVNAVFLAPERAAAIDLFDKCTGDTCTVVKENRLQADSSNIILQIMRIVLMALGSISVLMIVIGGLRFVLSQGDPSGVNSAKNTILYALIGLVVALLAGGIVQFVTGQFL